MEIKRLPLYRYTLIRACESINEIVGLFIDHVIGVSKAFLGLL